MSERKPPTSAEELIKRYQEGERDFCDSNLRGANLSESDINGIDLSRSDLSWSYLNAANLNYATLRHVNLNDANLQRAHLNGADLIGAKLIRTDLRDVDLSGSQLGDADLRGAFVNWVDLSGADLRGADLQGADLKGSNLNKTDLQGTNLGGANLRDTLIDRKSLRGAIYDLEQLAGANIIEDESETGTIVPPREIPERWMAKPAKLSLHIKGPRIPNRYLFTVIGALEHYHCSMYTMLHRPYENADELNGALRSPFHEVPNDFLLAINTVRAGSVELILGMPAAIGAALLALGQALKLRNTFLDGELKDREVQLKDRDIQLKDLAIQEKWLDVQKKRLELKAAEKSQETAIQKVDNEVSFPPLSTDEGEHPSPIAMAVAGKYRRMELTPNLSQEECARVIDGGCDRIRRVMEYTAKNDVVIELELSDLDDIENL